MFKMLTEIDKWRIIFYVLIIVLLINPLIFKIEDGVIYTILLKDAMIIITSGLILFGIGIYVRPLGVRLLTIIIFVLAILYSIFISLLLSIDLFSDNESSLTAMVFCFPEMGFLYPKINIFKRNVKFPWLPILIITLVNIIILLMVGKLTEVP
jgi:hypothetical protein